MAMKTSAILLRDGWHEVYKAPATDPGKVSKKGFFPPSEAVSPANT